MPYKLFLLTEQDSEPFFMILFSTGSDLRGLRLLENTIVPTSNILLFLLMTLYLGPLINIISFALEALEIDVCGLILWRGWDIGRGEGSYAEKSANTYMIGISSNHFINEIDWGKRIVNVSIFVCSNLIFSTG